MDSLSMSLANSMKYPISTFFELLHIHAPMDMFMYVKVESIENLRSQFNPV